MSVYILPGFLSARECEIARSLFPEPQPAAVNVESGGVARRSVRRSKAAFLPPNARDGDIAARLRDVMIRANVAAGWRFELSGVEPLQLAEYGEGDEYGWHLDIGPGAASLRKLSATVQLSDPDDYEGGALEIWGTDAIDRAIGSAVVFPSYLVHRVLPVTRGVRRSLVAWMTGEKSYR